MQRALLPEDEKLRKNHYHGLPFKVTNYFDFIARETRELMAQLGVKRLVDLIGRTDLLKELEGFTAKQQKLELSKLLETAQPHPRQSGLLYREQPAVRQRRAERTAAATGEAVRGREAEQNVLV